MHPNAVTLGLTSVRFANPVRRRPALSAGSLARAASGGVSNPRSSERASPTLDLSRACSRESAITGQWESYTILFLGGCAASVVAGCLFHMERFVAHWDSFESFVRALVA